MCSVIKSSFYNVSKLSVSAVAATQQKYVFMISFYAWVELSLVYWVDLDIRVILVLQHSIRHKLQVRCTSVFIHLSTETLPPRQENIERKKNTQTKHKRQGGCTFVFLPLANETPPPPPPPNTVKRRKTRKTNRRIHTEHILFVLR